MIESSTMRLLRATPLFLLGLALPALASDHTPPPVQPATAFAAVEAHDDEKVVIAAEPYGTREKQSIFRVDYLASIPMPSPIPKIKLKPKGSNKEIEQDFNTFEYSSLTVAPHSTCAGFLFYDVSGLDHPLVGASLLLRKLRDAGGNELYDFEIPFNKYLKSKSNQMN